MKVFVSWSGDRSKTIANALKGWLPDIFQGLQVWMSDHDIQAGARWGNELSGELEMSSFGILCLTPENLESPWLIFEAGALSKAIKESRVAPYCFQLRASDVGPPLSQFQGVDANEEGTLKLVRSINDALGKPLADEQRTRRAFKRWWPDLRKKLVEIPSIARNHQAQSNEINLDYSFPATLELAKCLAQASRVELMLAGGDSFYRRLYEALHERELFDSKKRPDFYILLRRSSAAALRSVHQFKALENLFQTCVEVRWYDWDFMLRGYCFDRRVAFLSYFLRTHDIYGGKLIGRYNQIIKVTASRSKTDDFLLGMFIKTFDSFFTREDSLDFNKEMVPFIKEI